MSTTNKKKKVGILTFHSSNNNFGAILQTYSVYHLIGSLGYDPYIINFRTSQKGFKAKIVHFVQKITGYRFALFRKKHIPNILKESKTKDQLWKLNKELDAFTVGSDQVWRCWDNHETLRRYFLDFVDDEKPKIAIAASFGLEKWNEGTRVTEDLKKLIKRFVAISVREESGVAICKNVFEVESVKILDPTMLVNANRFHELANKSALSIKNKKRYIAYMLLDDSKKTERFLKNIAHEHQLSLVKIKGKKIIKKPEILWFNSIYKWLDYLRKSELVITDSFHCVIFSLIFRKKFICLTNEKRGATRLKNILSLIGEEDRFFTKLDKLNIEKKIGQEIDYKKVWDILENEKQQSLRFLRKNFSFLN